VVDPANASELLTMTQELGADVLEGALSYSSDTGGWQLGALDLSEYLKRCRRSEDSP